MKKLIIILAIFIGGCNGFDNDTIISKMKPPVKVIAISQETEKRLGCVVIMDANGQSLSMLSDNVTGQAIIMSKQIGDTIK